MRISPQWVGTFEKGLQTLILDTSARITKNLIWDKFVEVRQSATLTELYFFLIEAAQLRKEGQGGNKRYDDQAATFFEVTNENSGDGLILTKNEIQDNVMASPLLKGMSAMQFSENWARQMGALSTRWPQDSLFDLLSRGETELAYDGVPFFSKAHPINKYGGPATYANLFSGAAASTPSTDEFDAAYPGACPIDESVALDVAQANFAKAVAYIQSLKGANGKPRNLVVKYAKGGVGLRKRLSEVLDTKFLTLNGIENVVSRYGIEPVIASEIGATDKSYYLYCEIIPGEGGPIIYQDREGYVLSSYSLDSDADLQRRKQYEWSYDGRNTMAYGHPYLCFKVKAS